MKKRIRRVLAFYIQCLCDLLVFFCAAQLLVVDEIRRGPTLFLRRLAAPLFFVDNLVARCLNRPLLFVRGHSELSTLPASLGMAALLACICFAFFRLVRRTRFGRLGVDYLIIILIMAMPLFTPILEGTYIGDNGDEWLSDAGHLHASRWLEILEAAIGLMLVCLGRFRKWPTAFAVVLVLFHYGFWALIICGGNCRESIEGTFLYILLPLAAGFVWALLPSLHRPLSQSQAPRV